MIGIYQEKVKPLHKYYPATIRTVFSAKIVLDGKMQNNAFWNISDLDLFWTSAVLNINFNILRPLRGPEQVRNENGFSQIKNCQN